MNALGGSGKNTYINNRITGSAQVFNPTEETVCFGLWLVSYNRLGTVNKFQRCIKPAAPGEKERLELEYRVRADDETIKLFVWTKDMQPLSAEDKMQVNRAGEE